MCYNFKDSNLNYNITNFINLHAIEPFVLSSTALRSFGAAYFLYSIHFKVLFRLYHFLTNDVQFSAVLVRSHFYYSSTFESMKSF